MEQSLNEIEPLLNDTRKHWLSRIQRWLHHHILLSVSVILFCLTIGWLSFIFWCLPSVQRGNNGYHGHTVFGTHGGVAVEAEECSNVGVQILQQGGNAVDSAIASALCIGVINNHATGIGGGGFMLIRSPNGTYELIDFRERAPAKAHQDMFVEDPMLAQVGALSIATPGEIRGFELAHRRHGKLEWYKLFEPAIHIARYGFVATAFQESRLELAADWIMESQVWKDIYAPNGTLAKQGGIIRRPALANTLETIAKEGADAFYKGPIAEQMIRMIQENGGILSMEDLASYKAIIRPTINTYYHGRKVTTGTSPTSGPMILSVLNLLERYNLRVQGQTALNIHRLLEAFKFGYAFRTEMGDPDYLDNEDRMHQIISKEWASLVRKNISDEKTFEPSYYQPKYDHIDSHGTMHLSVIDENDGAVALTSTVNLLFGSRLMDAVTGVIFNDQMDDFSIPGTPNMFGLSPSKNNYVAPGKRPLSSITPVIVEYDTSLELVLGGSGGSTIPTSTLNVLLNVLDYHKDLYEATESSRFHHQLIPNLAIVEDDQDVFLMEALKDRGHQVLKK
ncbi:gamma-glutamyltransferase [Halteromyces radiatus]|uniref:gamma-glutamyltransferase n=1 Tax=Halteromyces radiatus TaxID=101107 RepID=UPI002220B407|nr:gamma-glutamyltransferase [Halteromyces radiatus]KAI8096996.1 gamma-glutamyltransferase [Halteromyces radiatus]